MRKLAALLVLLVVVSAACGGRSDVYAPQESRRAQASLPPPVPASPAYLVRSDRPFDPQRLRSLDRVRGVAAVAALSLGKARIAGPKGRVSLRVAAVDALRFRPVAPGPTRDAEFVWTSLLEGQAVVTFDAARRLGLEAGDEVSVPGYGSMTVGAFADNGAPNVADVLVDISVGSSIGLRGPKVLVIGVRSGTILQALGDDLQAIMPGARLRRLTATSAPAAPRAPQPVGVARGAVIGEMTFRILRGGFIDPDPAWVSSNIAAGEVPILGTVTCHRLMFPQLRGALGEVASRGLARLIREGDYGGCFVPRFIDRDPSKSLSMHAFGLAVDLNVSTNGLGTRGDIDPRIVEIFERWGFEWGGRWSRPDPMHFELARLLGS